MRRSFILICVALLFSMFANAQSYTITATAGANGSITPSGDITVNEGEDQAFTIEASTNYRIASVLVDDVEAKNDLVEGVYTFVNVTANHTIAATFEEIPAPTYTITLTVGEHGTVYYNDEAVSTSVTVNENSTPAFTFTPETGYRVASVTLDGETNVTNDLVGNVYTFAAVTDNHSLAVTFEEIPAPTYTITASASEGGSITPEGVVVVNADTDATFTILANEGYRLVSVIVDANTENEEDVTAQCTGSLIEPAYTFTNVNANHTIHATFEGIPAVTYTIAFTIGEHGTVTYNDEAVTTSVTVNENATPSFTFIPENDYRVASVILDGETDVTTELVGNVYTFAAITDNHSLAVTFEEIPITPSSYTITATAGANGTITPSGEVTVEEGENQIFTIAANTGYRIASVIVDAETEGETNVTTQLENGVYTFTNVTANHTIAATFEEDNVTPSTTKYGITFVGLEEGDEITVPVTVDSSYVHTAEVADSVVRGNDFVFGFVLADCHQIDKVIVNEVELVADGEGYYTLENVVSDTTINIEYTEVKYNLTISAGEHGSVAVATAEVDCGANYTVTFVPENGYKLGSVLLDGEAVTTGISGNNYTLAVLADHTIHGEFVEFRGPYAEYVNLENEYEVGDTIDFSVKMHANCMFENLCAVGYELRYWNTDTTSIVVTDATRYGVFSYNVNVTDSTFVSNQVSNGSGNITYTTNYGTTTYNVGAFTLGLFDAEADRDRTIDYNMIFTTNGHYQFKTTLYTCANGGDVIGSSFEVANCDDLTHYDRVAETCSNPREANVIVQDINITGATIHTITATVLGGHGTVDPDGTIILEAGENYDVVFTPDEYYALDTVMINGYMRYPSSGTQYVVDSIYHITNISENYNITVKYKDVRPYYTVHVEIATAGGTVTPKDTSVVIGSDVTLTVTPNAGYHISQLSIDGNIIANYASNEIIFRDIHEDHDVSISFFPNSIEDEMFANLSIFPNPNNGQFTVSSDDFDGEVTFQIFSVSGAVMDEMSVNGEKTVSINKSLPAGTYFLRIISGDKVATRKIVVE